jgi:hypothetical protein
VSGVCQKAEPCGSQAHGCLFHPPPRAPSCSWFQPSLTFRPSASVTGGKEVQTDSSALYLQPPLLLCTSPDRRGVLTLGYVELRPRQINFRLPLRPPRKTTCIIPPSLGSPLQTCFATNLTFRPSASVTGGKGLPLANTQRPLVASNAAAAVHSAIEVGFDSGKMNGRLWFWAMRRKILGLKAPNCAATPTRMVGLSADTADSRSR